MSDIKDFIKQNKKEKIKKKKSIDNSLQWTFSTLNKINVLTRWDEVFEL